MQNPLCADIMSYYKKKNPRGWINTSSKQTASITALYPQGTFTLSGGCKVSGRIPGYSLVCRKRCTPRHDITTLAQHLNHTMCTFAPFYQFICRTAMFSRYGFLGFSCNLIRIIEETRSYMVFSIKHYTWKYNVVTSDVNICVTNKSNHYRINSTTI